MSHIPFRWDLTNRNHLGSLIDGEKPVSYPDFLDDLLRCCSKVLAFGGDSDLIFVGRSPESIFDHLISLKMLFNFRHLILEVNQVVCAAREVGRMTTCREVNGERDNISTAQLKWERKWRMRRVFGVSSSQPPKSLIADVTWYSIRPTNVLNQRGFTTTRADAPV